LTATSKPSSTYSRHAVQETELIRRHWISKKAFEIELLRPPGFQFKAGQTIRFVHGDIERYYSIISAPGDPTLALCVRSIEGGKFSPALASADIGTRFKLTGPHGYFTFNTSPRPPVFVATGTGIAPFVSIARSGVSEFTLLHGVSSVEDLYYEHLFRQITNNYVPCTSDPTADGQMLPGRFQGWVSDYIRKNLPRTEYDFYLCGRDEMVRDVTLLIDDCFPGSRVFFEVFF
jgi:ferredoxin-NADP reductase